MVNGQWSMINGCSAGGGVLAFEGEEETPTLVLVSRLPPRTLASDVVDALTAACRGALVLKDRAHKVVLVKQVHIISTFNEHSVNIQ
jgi:hypothetical protein